MSEDQEIALPELDPEAVERGVYALCRFIFPGYVVPRVEMVRAVLTAAANGPDWETFLPPKRRVGGDLP